MGRWIGIGAGALVVIALVWFFLGRGSEAAPEGEYRTATASRGDVVSTVSATGRLEALVTVEVGSQLSGQLLEVNADFNDPVTAGEAVARIDPATFQQRVLQAEADLAVQRASARAQAASIDQAAADYEVRQRELQRIEPLAERGIASQAALDDAQTAERRARAALVAARAQADVSAARVQQAEASLANAKVDLERTIIRSPVDGIVVGRNVDVGQTVAASLQAPVLFTIAQDLSLMRVEIQVDEADIGAITPGQAIRFTVDAFPDRSFEGAVEEVRKQPTITSNVVTYVVTAETRNPRQMLLPGMTANVEIVVDESTDVARVPNAALRFSPVEGVEVRDAPGQESEAGGSSRGRGEGGGRGNMLAQLGAQLNLDADQQRQVDAIAEETQTRMRGVFGQVQSGAISRDQVGEQMRALTQQAMTRIEPILNDEQNARFTELRAQMAGGRGGPAQRGTVYQLASDGALVRWNVQMGAIDSQNAEITSPADFPADAVLVVGGGPSGTRVSTGAGRGGGRPGGRG